MRGRRLHDPVENASIDLDRTLGYQTQGDIGSSFKQQEQARRFLGLDIFFDAIKAGQAIRGLVFKGDGIDAVTKRGSLVEVEIGSIDPTPAFRSAIVDLCAQPQRSGSFELEDSDITDDSYVDIKHVGSDEDDDEPEMDGIQFYPNPPTSGRVRGSWQAIPGPASGSVTVRYLIATAS